MRPLCIRMILPAILLVKLVASQTPGGPASGTITGHVRSVGGSALRGASVEVINTQTSEKKTVSAGEEGTFQISGLAFGKYQVVIRARGYLSKPASEIDLTPWTQANLDVALKRQHPDQPMRTVVLY